ncbi:MAG: small basic protein [bacterium]|nr:small basic protein [bacterium]
MSRHPSFGKTGIVKKRNVLKRFQRIDLLRKQGRFKEGDSVYGLPKTKPQA